MYRYLFFPPRCYLSSDALRRFVCLSCVISSLTPSRSSLSVHASRRVPNACWLLSATLWPSVLSYPSSHPWTFSLPFVALLPNGAGLMAPSFSRCGCSPSGRALVVCIDGTANQFSVKVSLWSFTVSSSSVLIFYEILAFRIATSWNSTAESSRTTISSHTTIVESEHM
jgi:hypothetical protein